MAETDEKEIAFLGSALDDILKLPKSARREIGYDLNLLQSGAQPRDSSPMKTVGPGVQEIRVNVENQYRVFYIAKFVEAIYVLHTFEKKSRKTAQRDINIAKMRLRDLALQRRKVS